MRLPTLLAAAVTASLAVAGAPAHAVSCNLIVDQAGDGRPAFAPAAVPSSPDLDIVSGDVASDGQVVRAAVRLSGLGASPLTTLGAYWTVAWEINGNRYVVRVDRDVNGAYTADAVVGFTPGTISWRVDVPTNALVVYVPSSRLPDLVGTTGAVFEHLSAGSYVNLGATTNADLAVSTQTYVDRTVSCLR